MRENFKKRLNFEKIFEDEATPYLYISFFLFLWFCVFVILFVCYINYMIMFISIAAVLSAIYFLMRYIKLYNELKRKR